MSKFDFEDTGKPESKVYLLKFPSIWHGRDHLGQFIFMTLQDTIDLFFRVLFYWVLTVPYSLSS